LHPSSLENTTIPSIRPVCLTAVWDFSMLVRTYLCEFFRAPPGPRVDPFCFRACYTGPNSPLFQSRCSTPHPQFVHRLFAFYSTTVSSTICPPRNPYTPRHLRPCFPFFPQALLACSGITGFYALVSIPWTDLSPAILFMYRPVDRAHTSPDPKRTRIFPSMSPSAFPLVSAALREESPILPVHHVQDPRGFLLEYPSEMYFCILTCTHHARVRFFSMFLLKVCHLSFFRRPE